MKIFHCISAVGLGLLLTGCTCVRKGPPSLANFFTRGRPPFIKVLEYPQDQLVQVGSNATFSVNALPSDAVYQWRFSGINIPGADGKTLTLPGITTANVGAYDCVISTAYESKTAGPAFLTSYSLGMTNTVNTITLTSGDIVTPPPVSSTNCPNPYVSRVRFPAGLGTVTKTPGLAPGSYWAYDPTGSPSKITWQGNVFTDRGCGYNGPVGIATGTSTKFFFMLYLPTAGSGTYSLVLSGFY